MSADKRQAGKNAEQLQKDFKKSHEILTQRFSRKVGKGQISAFDVLLRDVEKLKNLQNKTVWFLKCFLLRSFTFFLNFTFSNLH